MAYRTSRRHFEELAEEAMRRIPAKFRRLLRNVAVIVEDLPSDDAVKETGAARDDLLGLFRGQEYEERNGFFTIPSPYPDTVFLYQKNIEEVCASESELVEEIRMTILHEVGHYFGLSEEDLEEFEDRR